MAVKTDDGKVIVMEDDVENESQSFLPHLTSATKTNCQTWQTRIPPPLRSPQALWSFIIIALLVQAVICGRIFFPPGPEYLTSPLYNVSHTVGLITEYYRLLQDLRYLGRDNIAYPPHTGPHAINLTLCHELGLSQSAIETLQQLPYVTPHEDRINITGGYLTEPELAKFHESDKDWYLGWMTETKNIFWQDGHFLDYRNDTHLLRSRDPLQRFYTGPSPVFSFYDAMVKYDAIPKSAIPLSFIPRRIYGLSIVLDTADGRIAVLDPRRGGNHDPLILNQNREKIPDEYRIETKFYGNSVPARLGNDFLKDLIVHTAMLDHGYIPGSVRIEEAFAPELSPPRWESWVSELYWDYGWPRGDILKDCRYAYFGFPWVEQKQCEEDPLEGFNGIGFDVEMKKLRQKIDIQYMRDWYCPVPREQAVIESFKHWGGLTEEQIAFAESDEPMVVEILGSWAKNLAFAQD
jgi:hypothetical protein